MSLIDFVLSCFEGEFVIKNYLLEPICEFNIKNYDWYILLQKNNLLNKQVSHFKIDDNKIITIIN